MFNQLKSDWKTFKKQCPQVPIFLWVHIGAIIGLSLGLLIYLMGRYYFEWWGVLL